MNVDTQKRVRVLWKVCLTMPAYIYGSVDVEATSAEEAAQLAVDKHVADVDWNYDDFHYDDTAVTVLDVECEHPLVDAVLRCPRRKTGANLDALFGPEAQPDMTEKEPQKANDRGEPCR